MPPPATPWRGPPSQPSNICSFYLLMRVENPSESLRHPAGSDGVANLTEDPNADTKATLLMVTSLVPPLVTSLLTSLVATLATFRQISNHLSRRASHHDSVTSPITSCLATPSRLSLRCCAVPLSCCDCGLAPLHAPLRRCAVTPSRCCTVALLPVAPLRPCAAAALRSCVRRCAVAPLPFCAAALLCLCAGRLFRCCNNLGGRKGRSGRLRLLT